MFVKDPDTPGSSPLLWGSWPKSGPKARDKAPNASGGGVGGREGVLGWRIFTKYNIDGPAGSTVDDFPPKNYFCKMFVILLEGVYFFTQMFNNPVN